MGHVVSENGVQTDPNKINALASWPEPNNVKELRSFLGFTGYYRRFIRDYSKIVKPLNDLLVGHCTHKSPDQKKKKKKKKVSVPWQWVDAQQIAFNTIKETLVVTSCALILDAIDTQFDHPVDATDISTVDWAKEQSSDVTIGRVIELLKCGYRPQNIDRKSESNEVSKYFREWSKLSFSNNILYRSTVLNGVETEQLFLPVRFHSIVLQHLHDDVGHQGRDRTLSLVRARFYWPGLESDVLNKVKNCEKCIKRKTIPAPSAELVNITSSQPMELVCIDFLSLERSKGGFENILVITDHFTRYAQAFPTRNQEAKTTAKVLFDNFIVHYGFPARLHSDQGRNFESNVIKELCSLASVEKSRTTPYHPMGNGMVERFNQTLLNMLGTLKEHQKETGNLMLLL